MALESPAFASASASAAVNDCLSFEGDVIGEGPALVGDPFGDGDERPMTVVGEEGEEGRRKGDARGELKEMADGL